MIEPSELIQLMRTANTGKLRKQIEIIHKQAIDNPDSYLFYRSLVCLFRVSQDPKHENEPSKFDGPSCLVNEHDPATELGPSKDSRERLIYAKNTIAEKDGPPL